MTASAYPNVHARVRLSQHLPDRPPRAHELEIWLKDRRFRVRDRSGRQTFEILADATDPRQLGALPRTIEQLMDRESEDERRWPEPTELFGDVHSGDGWSYEAGQPRFAMTARRLAPLAEQILVGDRVLGLHRGSTSTRLGRAATSYRGVITIAADGSHYQNEVTRIVAEPYLMLDDARAATNPALAYVREIVALEENTVTDADVAPPDG